MKKECAKRPFPAVRQSQISLCVALLSLSIAGYGQTNTLEAESGTLTGISVATSAPGYSGTGYVTGFERGDSVRWEFTGTKPHPPLAVGATLTDTQAVPAVRTLMKQLTADYGTRTWAGQHGVKEITYIKKTTGRQPLIVEGDLMDYSPSRVNHHKAPASYTEDMITLGTTGHVLSLCWHWNAPTNLLNTTEQPWWKGFYTQASTFDVAAAITDTNSIEYKLILRDIDAIAVQLKKMASSNIPVLWRPLHEPEGGWFWWGAKGAVPFKKLWHLLYDRLTTHHQLHNLIWVLSSSDPDWYPGDDVVDVVGLDSYPRDTHDTLSAQWETLKARFNGKKLIALTEFGGVPDIERMHRLGIWWAWFSPWSGSKGPRSSPTNDLIRIYNLPAVTTLPLRKENYTNSKSKQ